MIRRSAFLLAAWALCAGCISTGPDLSAYARNGVQYGQTEGRFRGRWWNYYERGRSFLDGEFWTEAEQDLRTALARRAADGLWARTYGLHFLPEYFPHRELGIALYGQGRIDEAIEQLESSWAQCPSARAAYHLGKARLAKIQAGNLDTEKPAFTLSAPLTSSPVGATRTELEGFARDDTYVAAIRIDSEVYPVAVSAPEIAVSYPVRLGPGKNTFTVAIEDLLGNLTEQEVVIDSDVDGPAVSFDTPVVVPGIVQGIAMDRAGVAAFRIAGQEAALDQGSDGLVRFSIDLATVPPPLVYECEDAYGNFTRGNLPVDVVKVARNVPEVRFAGFSPPALVPLFSGVSAILDEGALIGFVKTAAAEPDAAPEVKITNPRADNVFFEDEIVVDVEISASRPIRTAMLDEQPLDVIPDRSSQSRSRRIVLDEPGQHPIVAKVVDQNGVEAQDTVAVERRKTTVEEVGRLDVAFVELESDVQSESTSTVEERLSAEFIESGRFGKVLARDPDLVKSVLAEQDLSALLGDQRERLALLQVIPAEMLIVTKVYWHPDSIEIIVEGKATEFAGPAEILTVARADVEGPYKTAQDVKDLVHLLALKFIQELPRVQGKILDVQGATQERLITNLNATEHRVKQNLKVVIFRYGAPIADPDTGKVIVQANTEILGEGLLSRVTGDFSDARMLQRSVDYPDVPIEKGQLVVTK